MNTILRGIVGSTAYGMAGPDSDIDRLGIYAVPTADFHGLHPPTDRTSTIVTHDPGDITMHEAGKFARLCLGGNPTLNELLWLDSYEIRTPLGEELVDDRAAFLSAPRVRDAYYGYALAQFKRLFDTGLFQSKQRARAAKHARHMLRLLDQGYELYTTGRLTVKVSDPQWYIDKGNQIAEDSSLAGSLMAQAKDRLEQASTPLPEHPDVAVAEQWLRRVRARF